MSRRVANLNDAERIALDNRFLQLSLLGGVGPAVISLDRPRLTRNRPSLDPLQRSPCVAIRHRYAL